MSSASQSKATGTKKIFLTWGIWVAVLVTVIGVVSSWLAYSGIRQGINLNSAVAVYSSQAVLQIAIGILIVGGLGIFVALAARALVGGDAPVAAEDEQFAEDALDEQDAAPLQAPIAVAQAPAEPASAYSSVPAANQSVPAAATVSAAPVPVAAPEPEQPVAEQKKPESETRQVAAEPQK